MKTLYQAILRKFKLNSIRSKLLVALIFLTVISLVSVGTVIAIKVFNQTKSDYIAKISQNIKQIDFSINNYIFKTEEDSKMISSIPLIKQADSRITSYIDKKGENGKIKMKPLDGDPYEVEVYRVFESYVTTHPSIFTCSLGVEENGGFIQYPARDRYDGYDARDREWYKRAIENPEKVSFSEVYTTSTGELVVYVVSTVIGYANELKGVLSIDINLSDLSSMLKSINIGEAGYIVLTDAKGSIIAHSKDESLIGSNILELGIKELSKPDSLLQKTFEEKLANGKEYWINITKSSNSHVELNYLTFIDKSQFTKSANNILVIILVSIIIFTLISIFIAYILSSKISKPIISATIHAKKDCGFRYC